MDADFVVVFVPVLAFALPLFSVVFALDPLDPVLLLPDVEEPEDSEDASVVVEENESVGLGVAAAVLPNVTSANVFDDEAALSSFCLLKTPPMSIIPTLSTWPCHDHAAARDV